MYRLEVKGPNRIGIQPVPEHDIAVHLAHAEERGEDLPIYITLGAVDNAAQFSSAGLITS
jgi:vanillate/4-hydroxybenzoate decarboxylase subunit C